MRIGFDISIQELPEHTGVERAQATLLEALIAADAGHEYVLFSPGHIAERWRGRPGVTLVEGDSRPIWFWRESVVPREIRKQSVKIFHSPVAAIPLRAQCHLLATIHEVPWAEAGGAFGEHAASHKLRLHLAANFAARLLCVSDRTAKQVCDLHPDAESRVRVTPHGIDSRRLNESSERPEQPLLENVKTPFVLTVGRLRRKKNLLRLLDAFAGRVTAGGSETLVLAGPDGDASKALRDRAGQSDLAGRVVFTGYIENSVLQGLYRGASCVVHPSTFEGFGLPVLEGLAAGVPVIVSRQGAIAEAGGSEAVLAVDGEDASDMERGLCLVLDDAQLTAKLVAAGRDHVRGHCSDHAVKRVLSVYEELA
ncbi:MAG: glycosyltransferase family 1 protein [Planctomycetota bacterium]|nr:glycosyltransferase family 1 protein [Planctomycetota bacterium]